MNILVQQDETKDLDLLTLLKQYIKERDKKPGNFYLSLLHRLDRPVGGAIVFAKTSKAASRMADLFRKRDIARSYLAIVHYPIRKTSDTLVHYLVKDEKRNIVFAREATNPKAKKAILHYNVLAHQNNHTLVQVRLETGRPHQIRVQFQQIGHPLFRNLKYRAHLNEAGQQIALWAHELAFVHPVTKTYIKVVSKPPCTHPWTNWTAYLIERELAFY